MQSKCFKVQGSPSYQFFFLCIALLVSSQILCLVLDPKDSLIFFLKALYILYFVFKSMIHFGLLLYKMWDLGKGSFFACGRPNCSSPIYLNGYLSSVELFMHFCQKWAGHIYVHLFLDSLLYSIALCVCHTTNTTQSDYCVDIRSLKIR